MKVKPIATKPAHKKFGSAHVKGGGKRMGMGMKKGGALVVSPVKDSFVTKR